MGQEASKGRVRRSNSKSNEAARQLGGHRELGDLAPIAPGQVALTISFESPGRSGGRTSQGHLGPHSELANQ